MAKGTRRNQLSETLAAMKKTVEKNEAQYEKKFELMKNSDRRFEDLMQNVTHLIECVTSFNFSMTHKQGESSGHAPGHGNTYFLVVTLSGTGKNKEIQQPLGPFLDSHDSYVFEPHPGRPLVHPHQHEPRPPDGRAPRVHFQEGRYDPTFPGVQFLNNGFEGRPPFAPLHPIR